MRSLKTVVNLIASLAIAQHYVLSNQLPSPTFRVMVTKKGLDYLNGIGPEIATQLIPSMFKGQKFKRKGPYLSYNIKNVTFNELDVKKSSIFSTQQTGLNIQLSNVSLKVSADVNFFINKPPLRWFLKIFFNTGSMTFSTTGLNLQLAMIVTSDEQGQPVFSVSKCSFHVGDYHIQFGGGASWLNSFTFFTDFYLKEEKVCRDIRSRAESTINKVIPNPPVIKMADHAEISCALVGQPIFTEDYIITEHKGDFTMRTAPNVKPPFDRVSVPPFEPGHCVDKMVCLWVTEYVANTASAVYKRAGKLVFNITEDTMEDADDLERIKKSFLNLDTSTFSLIVPQLFYRYGSHNITLTVRAVKEIPQVTITKEQVMFKMPAAVDVYVNNKDQNIFPVAFTMGMVAFVNATVGVRNSTNNKTFTVTAGATGVKIHVEYSSSNIGQVDYDKINKLIQAFNLIKEHLLPSLNKRIKEGYEFHLMDGLAFVDPNLTHFKGGLLLETDFNYKIT